MKKVIVLFVVFLFVITACSMLPGNSAEPTLDIQAAIAQTIAVQNSIGTAVAQTQMAGQSAGPTIEIPAVVVPPSSGQAPTVQATAAPVAAEVRVTANTNANCRSGPAANFSLTGKLVQGDSAVVIGKNTDFGSWWMVRLADNTECWIVEDAITIAGDTSSINGIKSPITPTPYSGPTWNGTWTMWISGTFDNKSSSISTTTIKIVQNGNKLTYSFKLWGLEFTAYLTVSQDGMTATGSLVRYQGGTWNIILNRVPENPDQFRGKWYVGSNTSLDGEMCGATDGASKPDPCR